MYWNRECLVSIQMSCQTFILAIYRDNVDTTSEERFDRVCSVRLRHDFPFVACCPSHPLEERGIQTNFLQLLFIDTTPDVQMFARPWSNADAAPVHFNNVFFCRVPIFCVFRVISTFTFFSNDLQNNLDFEIGDLNPTSNILVKYFRIFCRPRGKRRNWAMLRSHLTVFFA